MRNPERNAFRYVPSIQQRIGGTIGEDMKVGDAVDAQTAGWVIGDLDNVWEQETLYGQAPRAHDTDGTDGIYETVARESPLYPFKYLGRCRLGARVNLDPEKARRMFICSPLRSDTEEGMAMHLALAAAACLDAFTEGWLPVAPHLYFPLFLPDRAAPCRYYGMQAGKMLMAGCDAMRVYQIDGKLSEGQEEEVRHAAMILALEQEIIDMTQDQVRQYLALSAARRAETVPQEGEAQDAPKPEGAEQKG